MCLRLLQRTTPNPFDTLLDPLLMKIGTEKRIKMAGERREIEMEDFKDGAEFFSSRKETDIETEKMEIFLNSRHC